MSIIQFRNGCRITYETLTLGDQLEVFGKGNYVFVKVTNKGFNILNLDTNRMLLKRHLYAKGMTGKEYPSKGSITVKVPIPYSIRLSKKPKQKVG